MLLNNSYCLNNPSGLWALKSIVSTSQETELILESEENCFLTELLFLFFQFVDFITILYIALTLTLTFLLLFLFANFVYTLWRKADFLFQEAHQVVRKQVNPQA